MITCFQNFQFTLGIAINNINCTKKYLNAKQNSYENYKTGLQICGNENIFQMNGILLENIMKNNILF